MADEHAVAAQGLGGGRRTVGGESAEVAAGGGIVPVDALAADLHRAAGGPGRYRRRDVGFRQVHDELHFRRVIVGQPRLGALHDGFAPVCRGGQPVDAAVFHRHVEALEVQKNVFHRQMPSFL